MLRWGGWAVWVLSRKAEGGHDSAENPCHHIAAGCRRRFSVQQPAVITGRSQLSGRPCAQCLWPKLRGTAGGSG